MSEDALPLPPPPVPADADLRHFPNMPLDVSRLRNSRMLAEADGDSVRFALTLYCVAWHELPAGSLPADDKRLARFAGLGRDLETWHKHKAEALAGFRPFADGRLYHPVLSEKVVEAWNSTCHRQWTLACERVRKENLQRKSEGRLPVPLPSRPLPCELAWPDFRQRSVNALAEGGPRIDNVPPENGLKRREEKRISSVSEIDAASAREARARVEPRLARSKAYQDMTAELARLAAKRREALDVDAP